MAGIARFTICVRRPNDSILHECQPSSVEYTYVASAINIALAMLAQDRSKDVLVDIASLFDYHELRSATFYRDRANTTQWINWFLGQLSTNFPIVVIDETLTNLDCLGYHARQPWDGNLQDFRLGTQGVHLNGLRVRDMIIAGRGTTEADKQRFRNFQFAFATTLVHEAGPHILITWLGKGRPDTPPQITAPKYGDEGFGESGRYFELRTYGETTEFYRDPLQGDGQCGEPHQIDDQGWTWRINIGTVNAVCMYNFTLPFRRSGDAFNPRERQSMGRNSTNPAPLGSRDRALMAQQEQFVPQFRQLRGYNVSLSDVKLVPHSPTKRLSAAA